jgi:heptosyltransferase-3
MVVSRMRQGKVWKRAFFPHFMIRLIFGRAEFRMNILFVTSTRIGDAVLSTGLLSHLVSQYPDARITVACGVLPAPLFSAVPGVERVIPLTKRALAGHWLSLWSEVCTTMWDLVVDLRSSALAWLLMARKRYVLRSGPDAKSTHRVTELGGLFGLNPPPVPTLWSSDADKEAASVLIPGDAPVLGFGATANWLPKIWPAENFAALAERLTGPGAIMAGAHIAVFGGPDERELARPLLEALPRDRVVDLVGGPRGVRGISVTAACLARCTLFVGNDSGLMHLAAAAGTPTVGLFGPSPPARYGPWGDHCAVASSGVTYNELVGAADFDHRKTDNLMQSLSVDEVERVVLDLWSAKAVV